MDAYESLLRADQAVPLGAEDLELLATSAYMLGRGDDMSVMERAYHVYLDAGEALRAARCAFWVGMHLSIRGEMGRGTGWLGRAQRLVEREGRECVEQGYLKLPLMFQQEAAGDYEAAAAIAAEVAEIGERFRDADLFALAVQAQGIFLIKHGRVEEGLGLLDEAMVAVTAGELSPIVSGLVYCGVILGCQDAYELRRAQEWTAALTLWCKEQPDMVAFTGTCMVHRAEVMQLHGAWRDAIEEARRAGERSAQVMNRAAAAQEAYQDASRGALEPQPGLALLRLAQGDSGSASAAIRRAVGETSEPSKRVGLLPAYVEIMLTIGDVQEARSAGRELGEISASFQSGMLGAMAAYARGAVDLADGDVRAALVALRRARQVWQELEVPYEAARVRVLLGLACRTLGDEDTAALELEAARGDFANLGAAPDFARVDSLTHRASPVHVHGLTRREHQVLRLIAAGKTNKAIAAELVLSERTVDRHVSNIFTKLGLSSRAAATAYAYEHRLV